MNPVKLDERMTGLFRDLTATTEIYGSEGEVLGTFTPSLVPRGQVVPIDLEELQRRIDANRPGVTTRHVFERLLSLTTDPKVRALLQEQIDARPESPA
jgi:hypothetical protein